MFVGTYFNINLIDELNVSFMRLMSFKMKNWCFEKKQTELILYIRGFSKNWW